MTYRVSQYVIEGIRGHFDFACNYSQRTHQTRDETDKIHIAK